MMRRGEEMHELIVGIARNDERIRAALMNGSRADPDVPGDFFQDYDIVYFVTEIASLKHDSAWIKQFGELMIMQMPEDMLEPTASNDGSFAYLMQFADGNRIDLTLFPVANLSQLAKDGLGIVLLDKDGVLAPFALANKGDYYPKPPTPKEYADCCNEFWWVCTYVAKGLWREEITYAKHMLDQIVREQLMKMLAWHIGVQTHFSQNPGKFGKYFKKYLEPEQWEILQKTYADASHENNWEALQAMCNLFRVTAIAIARHFDFAYPYDDDRKVSAHLRHVRLLPKNATEMY